MQTYEGYFENECRFIPFCAGIVPVRKRAVVTVFDEPIQSDDLKARLAEIDEIFELINSSDEIIPEFERVKFTREVDL